MLWCWGGEVCNPPEGVAVCPVAVCEERRERGGGGGRKGVVVVVGEATIGETESRKERRGQRVIIRAGAGPGGGGGGVGRASCSQPLILPKFSILCSTN